MKDILLERLSLYNFKNYTEASLHFQNKVVCFAGNNGSGKTNLLDAIHYLCVCKSFFNTADSQNITTGQDQASITGEFEKDSMPENIVCALRKGQRKVFKRNFKEYDKLADHIGLLPAVIITPYDIELIWEGSEVRRKFLDATISQQSRPYLDALVAYNHALLQRNNLLKSFGAKGGYNTDILEPWDMQLIHYGTLLYDERKKFLVQFAEQFNNVYQTICEGKEETAITYESDLHNAPMEALLKQNQDKDRILERTSAGIHKDELSFTIGGLPLKKFASQGQQKSFLFALKFAQYNCIRAHQGINPVLMLDDLLDKIDEGRLMQILRWLKDNDTGQIFITDTHLERIPELLSKLDIPHEVWKIEKGTTERA
jgi:DNA replication and repair protein RecF